MRLAHPPINDLFMSRPCECRAVLRLTLGDVNDLPRSFFQKGLLEAEKEEVRNEGDEGDANEQHGET